MIFLILLFGTLFFFMSGFLLVYLFYKKLSLSECIVYTSISSIFIITLICFLLVQFKLFNFINIIFSLSFVQVFLLIIILFKRKTLSIYYDPSFHFHFLFSILGICWRWFFRISSFKWGDGITSHIDKIIIENFLYRVLIFLSLMLVFILGCYLIIQP